MDGQSAKNDYTNFEDIGAVHKFMMWSQTQSALLTKMLSDAKKLRSIGSVALVLGFSALFLALSPVCFQALSLLWSAFSLMLTLALTVILAPFSSFIIAGGILTLGGFAALGYAHSTDYNDDNETRTLQEQYLNDSNNELRNEFILTSTYYAITAKFTDKKDEQYAHSYGNSVDPEKEKSNLGDPEKEEKKGKLAKAWAYAQPGIRDFAMYVDFGVSLVVAKGLAILKTDYQKAAEWSLDKAGFVASSFTHQVGHLHHMPAKIVDALASSYNTSHQHDAKAPASKSSVLFYSWVSRASNAIASAFTRKNDRQSKLK